MIWGSMLLLVYGCVGRTYKRPSVVFESDLTNDYTFSKGGMSFDVRIFNPNEDIIYLCKLEQQCACFNLDGFKTLQPGENIIPVALNLSRKGHYSYFANLEYCKIDSTLFFIVNGRVN